MTTFYFPTDHSADERDVDESLDEYGARRMAAIDDAQRNIDNIFAARAR